MHELSIASSIIETVLKHLAANPVEERIEKVHFLAGKMHAIIPESLSFHFDVLKKDHPLLEQCLLIVEGIPVVLRCRSCGKEWQPDQPFFQCELCGSAVDVVSGMEMRVDSIEVEESVTG